MTGNRGFGRQPSGRAHPSNGFTIIEILVVVAIIMILAGILIPTVSYVRERARKVECINNLKQMNTAIQLYKGDYMAKLRGWDYFPVRITFLANTYNLAEENFLCPDDDSNGQEGGKPDMAGVDQFAELDERPGKVPGTLPLSYLYEFSGAECSWNWDTWITGPWMSGGGGSALSYVDLDKNGTASWGEAKQAQLKWGDKSWNAGLPAAQWRGYPENRFPVLRCFWHTDNPNTNNSKAILNMAYSGNYFDSGAKWEDSAK